MEFIRINKHKNLMSNLQQFYSRTITITPTKEPFSLGRHCKWHPQVDVIATTEDDQCNRKLFSVALPSLRFILRKADFKIWRTRSRFNPISMAISM